MKVLVTGGTGTVGSRLVRRLRARQVDVAVLTHTLLNKERVPEGVTPVLGDLLERPSVDRALEGVDRVFLLTPLHPHESRMGMNVAAAAARAGVSRVVLLSVYGAQEGQHIPHFRSKLDIAEALADEGVPHAVVAPNNFFQNDLQGLEAIAEAGVYPSPLGELGLSRVDARDIADVAAAALLDPDVEGRTLPVNGADVVTGPGAAAAWSAALGREVRYLGGVEAWRETVGPQLPEWLRDDLEAMYRFFEERGLVATPDDLEAQRALLGREPRRYGDFVEEAAEGLR